MENFDPVPEAPDPESRKRFPWTAVAVAAAFLAMGAVALWLTQSKPNEQARQAIVQTLEKELDLQKVELDAQRDKVVDLTSQLEGLKQSIQMGTAEDGKQAVELYNKLAAQQRAEREKFKTLANQYNEKVAQLRKLQ